jgi:hypothetical protein
MGSGAGAFRNKHQQEVARKYPTAQDPKTARAKRQREGKAAS